ncbi:hypothetical protein AB5J49_45920 [Streptomyces sp. R28]|uniref:Ribosomal RNA large subunit methyltransferase K/L-like methyltransferase domain-containing protein n=1 Tax=Streptomyces sp. R28 TaxID=3238628 RepID=A0AB39QBB0_9ACTN
MPAERAGVPYHARRHGELAPPGHSGWRLTPDGTHATLLLRLGRRPAHRRAYRNATIAGTLHPPVAAAMAQAAELRPGQRVLDPCCGAGTPAPCPSPIAASTASCATRCGDHRATRAGASPGTPERWTRSGSGSAGGGGQGPHAPTRGAYGACAGLVGGAYCVQRVALGARYGRSRLLPRQVPGPVARLSS